MNSSGWMQTGNLKHYNITFLEGGLFKKAKWQKGIILTIKLLVDKGASPFIKLLVDKGATGFRRNFLLIVNYVGWCNGARLQTTRL